MKRQNEIAWNGTSTWLSGRHRRTLKEMCPYQTLNQRSQWLGGWREAMADRVVMADSVFKETSALRRFLPLILC